MALRLQIVMAGSYRTLTVLRSGVEFNKVVSAGLTPGVVEMFVTKYRYARDLEFEEAAQVRDEISYLNDVLVGIADRALT